MKLTIPSLVCLHHYPILHSVISTSTFISLLNLSFSNMYQLKFASLSFLIVFFMPLISQSSDPYYGTCKPRTCGGVNITYPFHIIDQQHSYCGYPGFEVSCQDGNIPILNISGDSYVIQQIWYLNQSFQVINSVLMSSSKLACSGSIRNLTLENDIFYLPKKNYDEVILFQGCSDATLGKYQHDMVKCGALAFDGSDPRLKGFSGQCSGVVSVPYEGENDGDLTEVLSRGVLLQWNSNSCSACTDSGGQCGFLRTVHEFKCFCSDRSHAYQCVSPPPAPHSGPKRSKAAVIGSVAVASALGILILIALIIYSKRRQSTKRFTVSVLFAKGTTENQNIEAFLRSYGSLAPKSYSYADIKKMTNSFKDKLGEGGYGSVYKGKLCDGRYVAVKVLKQLKGDGEEFINEVASISRTNHMNIVTLLGFCFERKKRALVYDYLPNGSLEKFIYGANSGQSLPWETVFNIAVGIAKGLHYLHRGCNARILHFDIKPHNILLDEDFCPKISDFGLARLCQQKASIISTLEPRGTIGYIAPEVFCRNFGGISHKSDVYSYGMMVLDMACGRKNTFAEVQSTSSLYFPQWIYSRLEDGDEISIHRIMNDEEKNLQRKMIVVSLWCIQPYPTSRPSMSRVVEMLEGCLESLEMPPNPDQPASPRQEFDISTEPLVTT